MTMHDINVEVTLPGSTEEWAEEVVTVSNGYDWHAERSDSSLKFAASVHTNMNAVEIIVSLLRDMEEGLREGNIDPMDVQVKAWKA